MVSSSFSVARVLVLSSTCLAAMRAFCFASSSASSARSFLIFLYVFTKNMATSIGHPHHLRKNFLALPQSLRAQLPHRRLMQLPRAFSAAVCDLSWEWQSNTRE